MPSKKKTERDVTIADHTRTIRDDAEEQLARTPKSSPELEGQTPDELIHELQVYQVELETQAEELRRTRLEAEESRDKFLDLYDFAPVALITLSDKGIITFVNLTASTLLGVPRSNLLTVRFGKFFAEKEANHWHRYFVDLFRKDNKQSVTLEVTRGDGSTFPAHLEGVRFTSISGVTTARVAISDISDIRRIEAAQRESEEKFRGIFDNINDGVHIHETGPGGKPGKFIEVNKVACLMLQYTREELLEHGPLDFVTGYHNRPFSKIIGELNSTGHAIFETEHRRKDGTVLPVEVNAHVIGFMGKRVVVSVVRDITGRRHAEESLRESEERFRMLFEQGSDPIFVADPKTFGITDCNQKAEILSGYTREELLSLRVDALHPEDVRCVTMENFMQILDGMNDSVDSVVITRDGMRVPVSITGGRVVVNGQVLLIGSFRDITRQMRVEEELRETQRELEMQNEALRSVQHQLEESRDQYLDLYEFAPVGYFTLACNATITQVNYPGATLLGIDRDKLQMAQFGKLVAPADLEFWDQYFTDVLNHENRLTTTLMIKRGDGSVFPARLESVRLTGFGDVPTAVRMAISNIADIRDPEQALRETAEKYRTLVDTTGTGFVILNDQGRVLDANPEYVHLTGYVNLEEIAGRSVLEWTAAYEKDRNAEAVSQCIKDGFIRNLEIDYVSTTGTIVPIEINAAVLRSGETMQVLTLCRDITKRKQVEEAIRESEERFRTLFEQSSDALFVTDKKTMVITDCNRKGELLTGYSRKELLSMRVDALHPEDIRVATMENFRKVRDGMNDSVDSVIITRDGRRVPVSISGGSIEVNGQFSLIGSFRDMTRQKKAEEALAESENKYRHLFEHAGEAIVVAQDNKLRLVNPRLIELTGYSEEELLTIPFLSYIHPSHHDSMMRIYSRLLKGEHEEYFPHYSIQLITREGGIKWVDLGAVAIDWEGRPATLNFLTDITERKKAEDALITAHNDLELQVIERTADLFLANLQLKTEIEHRKLIAESLKESAKITTILNEVIITANQADTLPQLFRGTLDRALELLDFDGGGIYLINKAEKTATLHHTKNLPVDFVEKSRSIPIDAPPYDTLFTRNEPIITEHFEELSPEFAKIYHFLSLASIPLVSKNKVIGALNVASTKRYTISADEKQVLIAIGRELGTTVERMIAEEEVKNVSVNLQTLFDSINEMVFVLDMKGHILKVNDTVVKRLQYTSGELTGMDVLELHVPERRNEALCNVQGMIAGTADSCPVPLQTKKQEVIEVETKVTRGWWNDQEVLIGVSRDVTEHNRAEKEIEWQATLIRSLLDSIPDIIFFKDKKGVYLGCNPPFAEFVGRSREEIIGMTDYELFDKEIADFFRENDERMLELGEPRHNEEWITYPGGRKILIDTLKTPYWGPDGTLIGVLGISRDITERKVSEENLLQLSDRLSLAVQAGGVGIWDFDVVTNTLMWDDQMFALYGITREQFSGAYEAWQAGLHPEDRVRGDIEIQKALHGEKEFDTEFRVLRPDGTIRTIRALALVQRDDTGLPLRMIGTNWDITDQKNAEKALQENDILLRLILSLSARFINISSDKIYHEISNALGELGRFAGVDRSYVFLLSPDGMTMSNTHEWCTEGIVPQRDTLQDLPTGMFPWWMEKIHRNETIHVPRVADLPPEASNEKDILLEQGIQSVLIVPLISQNTLIGFLGFDSVRHEKTWPENIITLVTITGKSISNAIERERAEEALRKSEEQLSLALEGSGVGLWDWRVQTGETIFNERWAGILGYTLAELSPVSIKTWESLSHPDDLARSGELLQSHFSGKTPTYECEARMKHKDGHWVWVLDRGKVVEWDETSLPIRMTGTHLDITERVRHEEEIAASLMEKETLLKEIHHRVKNNMQVISSLLNLQAKKIKDKETLEIFRESQNRVRSIALVHEKLYRSKSLSQIDFKEFLQKLGENLFLSYDARKDRVTLQISADEIYLPIDKAIPLGLITNELLTNSLKYAFPDRRKGTISIELRKDKENYLYIFRDDGSGFPNDVEFVQGTDGNDQAETLGLQLVIALVGQIQGTVNLDRVNGSAFEIRFSYEPKGEEQN